MRTGLLALAVVALVGFGPRLAARRSPTRSRKRPPHSSRAQISKWCRTIAPPATPPITSRPSRAAKKFKKDFWTAEVTKMIKVYGAPIDDADVGKIVDYLTANY